jgi:large subunit ribosomal protein L23
MIKPILTEKSLQDAKHGVYTFWVTPSLRKPEIAKLVHEVFNVEPTKVRTINYKPVTKVNYMRRKSVKNGLKKAFVTLKKDQKIEVFGEAKK